MVCVAAALVFSLMPAGVQPPDTGWDKSNHLLAFLAPAFTGHTAYPKRSVILLASLLSYGGMVEVLQSFTPDLMAEWSDLMADALGLALGSGVMRLVRLQWPGRGAGQLPLDS